MIETPTKGWACIKPQDALEHVLVVGPTGVCKSTFLYWWARSVIEQGHGLLVLDPKGDLVETLLAAVPPGRTGDTILLDFADTEWPVALNPLDVQDAAEGDRVAAAVYTMMKELVKGEDLRWGTSMSQAFAYGFRTLAANPQIKPSMLDLERQFFDRDWRQTLLPQVTDPFLRSYWGNQVDRTSTRQFELSFGGALRRMAMLVQDPRVRNILVQPRSAAVWDGVLAERKIVLANLDQADTALGAAGSRLLGSILVTQFCQAVLRRPADVRPPFFAVFDEFQEFLDTGRDMAAFFERSRSYGAGLTVATQNPNHPRLRPILDSVRMNTRTHVVFGACGRRCGTSPTRWRRRSPNSNSMDCRPITWRSRRWWTTGRRGPSRRRWRRSPPAIVRWPTGCAPSAGSAWASRGRRSRCWWRSATASRPEDATRETGDTTPTPAMPPQPSTATSVKVNAAEPLDGRDPNPREGA